MATAISVLMTSDSAKRRLARRHAVEDAAQAEQVAAMIDGLALALLGRHVRGSAHDSAQLRELGFRADRAGQAKVENLHAASGRGRSWRAKSFEPDVGRLDVAVDQPTLVRRRQAQRDLPADTQHLGYRKFARALQPHIQRLPLRGSP